MRKNNQWRLHKSAVNQETITITKDSGSEPLQQCDRRKELTLETGIALIIVGDHNNFFIFLIIRYSPRQ